MANIAAKSRSAEEFSFTLSDAEWRERLTAEQYKIMRGHGTERACTSPLNAEKRQGVYHCVGCRRSLFDTAAKFESGTGWPSFSTPIDDEAVATSEDRGYGMVRTEVHCAGCGSHLGHLFPDGPPPTGVRYCLNGVALSFEPA